MAIFKMHNTFFVFLRCTIGGGQNADVFLIPFLQLWLNFETVLINTRSFR